MKSGCTVFYTLAKLFTALVHCSIWNFADETIDDDPEERNLQFDGGHYYGNNWGNKCINKCHCGGRIRYCHVIQGFQISI